MQIELLGDNCYRCRRLAKNIRHAINFDPDVQFNHSCDLERMANYGLLALPGLIIDGELRASGQLLSVAHIHSLLKAADNS